MSREEIKEKVIKIVSEQLGIEGYTITEATNLQKDLKADSLDGVELVMKVEDEFSITIPDDEAESLQTVGDIINGVEKKLDDARKLGAQTVGNSDTTRPLPAPMPTLATNHSLVEELPLSALPPEALPGLTESVARSVEDYEAGRGTVRAAGERPQST